DESISFDTGIWTVYGNSYQGVFGSEITQDDIAHLTNIVQGDPEANYPDGGFPIHGDHIEMAVGAGLLDVNNDGITDMDDVAILQRYVDGARGEDLIDSDTPAGLIEQNRNYMNFKQEFYAGQIDGLNNLLEQWQAVNDDTGFARAQIAMISAQIKTAELLQEFVTERAGFWTSESDRAYPTEVYENREFVYVAMRDLETRYQAALSGESNENHLALQVELFKQEVILHNLENGISIEGLNADVGDIYNDGGLTTQGKAVGEYGFARFKVNFFNSNIEGLENTLSQWQAVNDDTGFAAAQIAAIAEQLGLVNEAREFWDTRDEFWHDQAFLTYDPSQTEAVKTLYLSITDLERRADRSILGESSESIDAIQQGIIQLTGVLDAMHGFGFEALTTDEDNQVRVLLQNRIIESILGATDVGDIYGDQDLDALMVRVAEIYGDSGITDSKFGFVPDAAGGSSTLAVYQFNAATAMIQEVNADTNLSADYTLFDSQGEINQNEYNRYQNDFVTAYGEIAFRDNAAELLPTYTGLTGAIHKEALDFQRVDSGGTPLPLERDDFYQILYSLENN
ncbi:MAG: hypothetical protein HOA17_00970, partial [Candidatus Melainabacteria bacterium]|nr:hypothetical protein [Candidatus Melainabacteria bacterium]